jgi:hypothetical protein
MTCRGLTVPKELGLEGVRLLSFDIDSDFCSEVLLLSEDL